MSQEQIPSRINTVKLLIKKERAFIVSVQGQEMPKMK